MRRLKGEGLSDEAVSTQQQSEVNGMNMTAILSQKCAR